MRVFISFASEDRPVAEQIHFALTGSGYETFYDKESLPPGGDFNTRISAGMRQSDLLVFLISPDSVQQGSYALTELRYARKKWTHPKNRVLPVMIRRVSWDQIPGYLSAITILEPEGNVAAEVSDAVSEMARNLPPKERHFIRNALIVSGAVVVIAGSTLLWNQKHLPTIQPEATTSKPNARTEASPGVKVVETAGYSCEGFSDSRNPIVNRAAELQPPEYTVDTKRHLLLTKDGKTTAVVPASSFGKLQAVKLIVVHFSMGSASGAASYFRQPDVNASVHLMIARDGTVQQFVPFDFATHHAGRALWQGIANVNANSIGIDLENWGPLEKKGDVWTTYGGRPVPDPRSAEVLVTDPKSNKGWERYTCSQLRTFLQVARALKAAYPTLQDMVGHDTVSGGRRQDPGPAFPIAAMRDLVFGRGRGTK